MSIAVIRVPSEEIQPTPVCHADGPYRVHVSNLKLSRAPGKLLGSFSVHIPAFDLHLWCSWMRDDRGRERVGMPRVKVETPDGRAHLKSLARWGSARAEEQFQRATLQALHQFVARTEARRP